MNEPTIVCPKCKTQIKLTDSLAAPILEATRKEYEAELERKNTEVAEREAAVRKQFADLAKAREAIDEEIAARLGPERERIASRRIPF